MSFANKLLLWIYQVEYNLILVRGFFRKLGCTSPRVSDIGHDVVRLFYASSNIVFVEKGETGTVSITSGTDKNKAQVDMSNSYVSCYFEEAWRGNTISLFIEGKHVGTTLLTFTERNSAHEITVIVVVH